MWRGGAIEDEAWVWLQAAALSQLDNPGRFITPSFSACHSSTGVVLHRDATPENSFLLERATVNNFLFAHRSLAALFLS